MTNPTPQDGRSGGTSKVKIKSLTYNYPEGSLDIGNRHLTEVETIDLRAVVSAWFSRYLPGQQGVPESITIHFDLEEWYD